MVERIRIYKGVTEVDYTECKITKSNDTIVDECICDVSNSSSISTGDVIDFKRNDGSTQITDGKVVNKNNTVLHRLRILTNGFELNNVWVEQVYTSVSPEYIVEDIITNYTSNLVYASTDVSGFTLTGNYVAKGYAVDIIKDMLDILDWQLRIDENNNVYFEPKGSINNGVSFVNGENGVNFVSWENDLEPMFNEVKVIGGFESFSKQETISGTGTSFVLSEKPSGSVRVLVSSVEIDPSLYEVDAENKTVTFSSSRTNPFFSYSFNRPIVVVNRDDDSINDNYLVYKEVQAPWLTNRADAIKYSQQLLDAFSRGDTNVKAVKAGLDFSLSVGEVINCVDSTRNESASLVISMIEYDGREGSTTVTLGSRDFVLFDWQNEVKQRIKDLEKRISNVTEVNFARLLKSKFKLKFSVSTVVSYNSPNDSFTLGHPTLGRLRSGFDYEPDCSDNGYVGTWNGTGVTTGAQFDTGGYRLSCSSFNGSDIYMTTSTITGVKCFSVFLNPNSLNSGIATFSSGVSISVDSSGVISTTGLSNVSVYVDKVLDGTLSTGSFQLLTVNFDAVDFDSFELGRVSSSYFNGFMDECMLFDSVLSTVSMQVVLDKDFYTVKTFNISGLLAYFSFDNPKLGDRSTTPIVV